MDWIIFCAIILHMRTYTEVKFRFTAPTAHANPFTAALKLVYWAKIQTNYAEGSYRLLHPVILS
ncbi:hypothetical protein B7P43_G15819 [Cryptotermes secundus]|uniref:Uncharacterized protein n=1 Tax=Cryptotermes secundus TaxID=105785 RepID=A0A2J7PMI4_9NEOP|nr:hypothetical protein B7P43_G15819 [Cryptotermes secundus]